ncbi:N-6 DNA methylase [Candidatus Dojkabacteria bacterium]|nr:N-6 DNA methylase [Candidatus Dojkabacteria bacterium]
MTYLSAKHRKEAGVHYTPKILADFVTKQILNSWLSKPRTKQIRLLDPAVGDGQLLLSLLEGLWTRNYSDIKVSGFDTSKAAVESARIKIQESFSEISLELACDDFLEFVLMNYAPNGQYSLFTTGPREPFDIVIANPPYVRTQVMGKEKAQTIARQFSLSGRVDLYYAFIAGIAHILRPGGIAGIIVSNRFLTTKSGASVRKSIIEKFNILHIWDLGDTRLFEAAVLPAVLLLERKTGKEQTSPKFTSIYSVSDVNPDQYSENVIAALEKDGIIEVENGNCYCVQQGNLKYGKNPAKVWSVITEDSEGWLARVKENTFCTFGDVGKIRVGVKTTADKVFIRSNWQQMPEGERPELLRPLTTHHIAQRFKAIRPKNQREILYPHQVINGKRIAVNLHDYPRAAKYLHFYRSVLEKREYVLKAGRQWYEIWVPQDPEAWKHPKVVFRDITEKPTFWMDLSGSVVNGDCYWLVAKKPEQVDLLWLILAIGNSSFIESFYDYKFNNKLYAGRRRFITQYVEKFPLLDPDTEISQHIIRTTKNIYDLIPSSKSSAMEQKLDQLVWEAFDLSGEKIAG